MIIIRPTDDEEEGEFFTDSQRNRTEKESSSHHISSIFSSKYITLGIILLLLLIILTTFIAFKNHSLKVQMELTRKNIDQIQQIEASLLNYPQSDLILPLSISLHQDLVNPKEIYNFESLLSHYLIPYSDTNCHLTRLGSKFDGGYVICSNLLEKTEVLLNFGIGDDDSFGCDVIKQFPIKNYQFDCNSSHPQKCQDNQPFHFSQLCVGDKDKTIEGKEYNKLSTILQKFKIEQTHMLIKIDVQGDEWEVLSRVPLTVLDQIDQLVIEFHLGKPQGRPSWHYIGMLKALVSKFIPVNTHMNNYGCFGLFSSLHFLHSDSFQVTFVNRRLVQLFSYERSYINHKQNRPNHPYKFDCQQS